MNQEIEKLLNRYVIKRNESELQKTIGKGQVGTPIYTRRFAAGSAVTWQKMQTRAYEVLILAGDDQQQLGTAPAYIRFGVDGPSSTTAIGADAMPVTPGTKIRIPQGVEDVWFLAPSPSVAWRLTFIQAPEVAIDYGPYGAKLAEQVLSTSIVTMMASAPTLITDGEEVPDRATRAFIHFAVLDTGIYSRVAASFDAQTYWMPEQTAPQLWAHNSADDFITGQLGQVGVDHDCEVMEIGALYRLAIVTTATPPSGSYVAIVTWMG